MKRTCLTLAIAALHACAQAAPPAPAVPPHPMVFRLPPMPMGAPAAMTQKGGSPTHQPDGTPRGGLPPSPQLPHLYVLPPLPPLPPMPRDLPGVEPWRPVMPAVRREDE